MRSWRLKAHAKINLFLEIGANRNGFHPIDSIFLKLALHDEMKVRESSEFSIVQKSGYEIPAGTDNILYKVWDGLRGRVKKAFRIEISKNIPSGGGLGGGSSDAASFLNFLDARYEVFENVQDKMKYAYELGKDIPFFLIPENAAEITGIQDEIRPFMSRSTARINIFFPGFASPTKEVYSVFDKNVREILTKNEKKDKIKIYLDNCSLELMKDEVFNDLEDPFFDINPGIRDIYEKIKQRSSLALLSGSGSCVYYMPGQYADPSFPGGRIIKTRLLGCRQAERQRPLEPLFGGSNPSTPAIIKI